MSVTLITKDLLKSFNLTIVNLQNIDSTVLGHWRYLGILDTCDSLEMALLMNNILYTLPLDKKETSDLTLQRRVCKSSTSVNVKLARRRIIQSDLFDSEASNDSMASPCKMTRVDNQSQTSSSQQCSSLVCTNGNTDEKKNDTAHVRSCASAVDHVLHKSMLSLGELYDNMSFTDAFLNTDTICNRHCWRDEFDWSPAVISHGLVDEFATSNNSDWCKHKLTPDISNSVQLGSLGHCSRSLRTVCDKMASLSEKEAVISKEKFCFPVGRGTTSNIQIHRECPAQRR